MLKLDHIAALIAVAAIVALSLWPLPSHGDGGHDEDGHGEAHGDDHGDSHGDDHGGGHGDAPHWSYAGTDGPAHWGDLAPAFAACKAGRMQSPIDISAAATGLSVGAPHHEIHYQASPLKILHNGHTVQLNQAPGSTMTIAGGKYDLLQFHFHAPSEHTVEGKSFPMEIHFVHANSHGELAVIGVMVEEGAANAALAEAWAHLPAHQSAEEMVAGISVDAAAILPPDGRYHHYKGSLTTPPCSENVRWFVLAEPISMSAAQIAKFEAAAAPNARPVQPLNARLLIGPN
jgi:carbonic anhydrase